MLATLLYALALGMLLPAIVLPLLFRAVRLYPIYKRSQQSKAPLTIGFFHPYCNAGGGGERVMWHVISSIYEVDPSIECVVYTGDTQCTKKQLLDNAKKLFGVQYAPARQPRFVYLHRRRWVEASRYPYFTMLGQSLGSIVLAWEALTASRDSEGKKVVIPDIWFDTMGYAFTYPLAHHLFDCIVYAYVHYPTISSDMLNRVSYAASSSPLQYVRKTCKLLYYHVFAFMYRLVGSCSSLNMCNSTWTINHINSLWSAPDRTHIVYPSVDVSHLTELPLLRVKRYSKFSTSDDYHTPGYRSPTVMSIGQWRPEKNHALQIRSFARYLKQEGANVDAKLVCIGGSRNSADDQRVEALKRLASDLKISTHVSFAVNAPLFFLTEMLKEATVGLHTMRDEHFGMNVAEFQAAGVIPIAHNSGGPRTDIVIEYDGGKTGFLAETEEEYAAALHRVLSSNFTGSEEMQQMRERARRRAAEFSDEGFARNAIKLLQTPLKSMIQKKQRKTQDQSWPQTY